MNRPENNLFLKTRLVGVEVLGGQKIKSGKFHELLRKSIPFFLPPPRMERVRATEGRTGGDREGEREREPGKEGGARAKPGNQLVIHRIEDREMMKKANRIE